MAVTNRHPRSQSQFRADHQPDLATRQELFTRPRHRYTEGLLASIPRLDGPRGEPLRPIRGTPRDVLSWAKGCAFAPRCDHADDACATPDLALVVDGPGDHRVRCVHPADAGPDEEVAR